MVELQQGDILNARVEAVVNTVNTYGVMGKGLALQIKRAYPQNFKAYERAFKAGELAVGRMLTVPLDTLENPRYIINFPTKQHWRNPSKLEFIQSGLVALVEEIRSKGIKSVAIPPLGCGNGGLEWENVFPLIQTAFESFDHVQVMVFVPESTTHSLRTHSKKPKLTRPRALLLELLHIYLQPGYSVGRIEIQKLMYFLKESGEEMPRLQFEKHLFGPYAPQLNHVLESLEGHYFEGLNDLQAPSDISLLPEAHQDAMDFLAKDRDALDRIDRIGRLIEGFETPFSMELLATTHFVSIHENKHSFEDVLEGVQNWNERKKKQFTQHHVRVAWSRLKEDGWL